MTAPAGTPTPATPGKPGDARAAQSIRVTDALIDCGILAVACLITYTLATQVLNHVHSVSRDDDLLGGMWAVIATVFVLRHCYTESITAAVSRMSATLVSFALCLVYLVFFPFHVWAMAGLIGLSALVVILLGRAEDAITAAITTAVVMVVAEISPEHAWQQPILRLADTVIGVAVGVAVAFLGGRILRRGGLRRA
jgi:uncharacterized membrane protein YgaE (UPF0421/DUF939 family)